MSHISAEEATQLLADATPGPWVRPSGTSSWFTVPEPVQVDEADWGPEAQERGLFGYRVGTLADERAWRYGDVELMAAAPRLAAEVVRLRRWQDEAMAVLAEWDNVHDALGQPGDLGQSKALASHFEVVRLRRELDARTDPELAARLYRWANGQGRGLAEDLRAAARLLGGGE